MIHSLQEYDSPSRHYHNTNHIAHCFAEMQDVRGLIENENAMVVAITYHDIVYDPKATDNEYQSALVAVEQVAEDEKEIVRGLVMATTHQPGNYTPDELLIRDIDLAILGQPADVYDDYARCIRKEYSMYSDAVYSHGRTLVLLKF